MSDDGRPDGNPEVAKMLRDIERSVEMDLAASKQSLTNHLHNSDQVIANMAALQTINDTSLLDLVKEDPT